MLTANLVRVRHQKGRIFPHYISEDDPRWRTIAERLLDLYRAAAGRTRGEIEEDIAAAVGDNATQLIQQGLAKVLEDRCEFDVESSHPPDHLRELVFRRAADQRAAGAFDRQAVLGAVAADLGSTPEQIDQGLFADLKAEQRLIEFKDWTADRLLQRYNVALAQAILMRSTGVEVSISGETPARYRQLFRSIKFHRLIAQIRASGRQSYTLGLDGPLSLFAATQKYGLLLAQFLPTLLHCKHFELKAAVRWGAQRLPREFFLDSTQHLRSHLTDHGDHVPRELTMFAESFRKQFHDWEISTEPALAPLPSGVWVPDFLLTQRSSSREVYLEVLGFWRRTDVEKLVRRLRQEFTKPFILAVSEQLNTDETDGAARDPSIYVFKRSPLPEQVAQLARQLTAAG